MIPGRVRRTAVLGGLALVAATGLTVAPAAAQEKPAAWTSTICSSLGNWNDELQQLSDDLPSLAGKSPRQAKALLVEFLSSALDVTETLVDDIEDAGYPDVDRGRTVARVFQQGVKRAREIFEEAEGDAEAIPTTTKARFEARARRIQRALQRGGQQVEQLFDEAGERYSVPELDEAFREEPACEGIS